MDRRAAGECASYVIRVNTSQVNADKTVSAGKNDLNYREQGHAVLLDLQEQVLTLTDADTVMTISATNGQIRVSKAGSLTVYPDNSEYTVVESDCKYE